MTGCEVTPTWATEAGEHHVNLDVALAFDGYARVSGDEGFIKEMAWPVMKGVACWIESRVEKTERGYEILHITGIDEGRPNVNNDSYSNIMAAKVLRAAAEYSEKLGYGKRQKWTEIADNMFIPTDRNGILQQYEGIPDDSDKKPTVLLSYFPYGFTNEKQNETIEYYVNNGMEEFCCYPMISSYLGVYPAMIGDRKRSLDFYRKGYMTFLCEPFYSCTEWGHESDKCGLEPTRPVMTNFITSRGGFLTGLIFGLTKMCPWRGSVDSPIDEWFGEDIVLPEGWNKIIVNKIIIRGKAYRLIAEHGAKRAILEEL